MEQDQVSLNIDTVAIHAEVNFHYMNLVVVTKRDIRIYDIETGRLEKVFSDVLDTKTNAEITSFSMDDRHRKFYVGDSYGSIRVYNISNGVYIKNVVDVLQDKKLDDDDDGLSDESKEMERRDKLDLSKEVNQLNFMSTSQGNKILVSTTWDAQLSVYDEDEDESQLLRQSVGGHGGEDIQCLTVSDHLALVATGSSSGSVVVWDFEFGKIDGYCIGHQKAVTKVQFIEPYPLLVTLSKDGSLCIWGVRGAAKRHLYKCLARFINIEPKQHEGATCGITSSFVVAGKQSGI